MDTRCRARALSITAAQMPSAVRDYLTGLSSGRCQHQLLTRPGLMTFKRCCLITLPYVIQAWLMRTAVVMQAPGIKHLLEMLWMRASSLDTNTVRMIPSLAHWVAVSSMSSQKSWDRSRDASSITSTAGRPLFLRKRVAACARASNVLSS